MTSTTTKRFVFAIALAAAAAGVQAAGLSHAGARDPFTDGARSVQDARDVYSEGAHGVQDPRSPYTDGARNVDTFTDGARTLAGLDRTGVSADPARSI
uniref:hypothetical protein n=2 Tax=Burkholderiaceae TaxID=119060 RepID=UPI0004937C2A